MRIVIEILDRHIKIFRGKKAGRRYVPVSLVVEDIEEYLAATPEPMSYARGGQSSSKRLYRLTSPGPEKLNTQIFSEDGKAQIQTTDGMASVDCADYVEKDEPGARLRQKAFAFGLGESAEAVEDEYENIQRRRKAKDVLAFLNSFLDEARTVLISSKLLKENEYERPLAKTGHTKVPPRHGGVGHQADLFPAGRKECIVMVPRRQVILRQMHLPSQDQSELTDMIGLHLMNAIPYPVEDIIYQYRVLERDSQGYSRVLVVILPRAVRQKYLEYVRVVRQDDVKVILSSYGILEWWSQKHRKQPEAVLDLGARHGEICFCHEGKLYFSRNLSYGREDVVNKNVAKLIGEITASLAVYQNQGLGPAPQRIMILLPFQEGTELQTQLETATGIPVDVTGTLDDRLRVPAAVQKIFSGNGQYSFTAGLGLLLSDTHHLPNLVPAEVERERQKRLLQYQCLRFAGLVLIAGILSVCGEAAGVHARSKSLKALEEHGRHMQLLAQDARVKIDLVAKFDRKFQKHHFVPALLEELRLLTPAGTSFRVLTIDGDGHVTIDGYAQDHAQVNQMQSGFIQSTLFQNVDLKFATNRRIANGNVMDFKFTTELKGLPKDGR
jgi:Tfp pilus assembly protein PilN